MVYLSKRVAWKTHLPILCLGILLPGVLWLLLSLTQTQLTISDSIGYLYAGQRVAAGYGLTFTDNYNVSAGPYFYPHAFRLVGEPTANATFGYPPGFPILIAAGVLLAQEADFAYFVTPILACLSLFITFWLGYLLTANKWGGVLAALVLAATAVFWEFATAPWSEIPSMVFITSGVGVYILSRQEKKNLSRALFYSIIAGALIGFSFLIRYTNTILVFPALAVYEWFTADTNWQKAKQRWFFWGVLCLFVGSILLFNQWFFNGPFNTIYNTPELGAYPVPLFSPVYAIGPAPFGGYSLLVATQTLWRNFSIFLFLVPLGWWGIKSPQTILVSGIALSTFGLYAIYAFSPKDINARFLLPMFPFLAIGIATGLITVGQKLPGRHWKWGSGSLIVLWFLFAIYSQIEPIKARNANDVSAVTYVQQMVAPTPKETVWMSATWNDLIAIYGHRSVLNYRRILQADEATGQFDMKSFEGCLVQTINRLLQKKVAVYFVWDEGWNMAEIMGRHFVLSQVSADTHIMQVWPPINAPSSTIECLR